MTTTTTIPTAQGSSEKPSWFSQTSMRRSLAVAIDQSAGLLYITVWFWPIYIAVIALITLGMNQWGDEMRSVIANSTQAVMWFPFAMTIGIVYAAFGPYLAAGATRRVISRGFMLTTVISGVFIGGVYVVLLFIERMIYDSLSWTHLIQVGPKNEAGEEVLVAATSGGWHNLFGIVLLVTMASLSGVLVAAVFMRYKAFVGVLTLPFTVAVPIGGAAMLLPYTAGRQQFDFIPALRDFSASVGLSYIAIIVLGALIAVCADRIFRTIPAGKVGS